VTRETISAASPQALLDALQAERDAEWPPDRLAAHAALRRRLGERADRDRIVQVGHVVPAFTLPEVDGGTVVLDRLLAGGPVVLLFFRFADCPACNAALQGYQRMLVPALRDLGASLVAVSPQVPGKLKAIKERHGFDFPVASDARYELIDQFGIGFGPEPEARAAAEAGTGTDLGAVLGHGRWDLPYPTAVVIDRGRVVTFADARPDWMVRTDPAAIITAVRSLTGTPGAGR
jgi:peroxiredoxin